MASDYFLRLKLCVNKSMFDRAATLKAHHYMLSMLSQFEGNGSHFSLLINVTDFDSYLLLYFFRLGHDWLFFGSFCSTALIYNPQGLHVLCSSLLPNT